MTLPPFLPRTPEKIRASKAKRHGRKVAQTKPGTILARRLITAAQIDAYLAGVKRDAAHHAPGVLHVIDPLSNEVLSRLDLSNGDKIEVYERLGHVARTCWIMRRGRRYAFTYNHTTAEIELKDRSLQGQIRFKFDNSTDVATIQSQIAEL